MRRRLSMAAVLFALCGGVMAQNRADLPVEKAILGDWEVFFNGKRLLNIHRFEENGACSMIAPLETAPLKYEVLRTNEAARILLLKITSVRTGQTHEKALLFNPEKTEIQETMTFASPLGEMPKVQTVWKFLAPVPPQGAEPKSLAMNPVPPPPAAPVETEAPTVPRGADSNAVKPAEVNVPAPPAALRVAEPAAVPVPTPVPTPVPIPAPTPVPVAEPAPIKEEAGPKMPAAGTVTNAVACERPCPSVLPAPVKEAVATVTVPVPAPIRVEPAKALVVPPAAPVTVTTPVVPPPGAPPASEPGTGVATELEARVLVPPACLPGGCRRGPVYIDVNTGELVEGEPAVPGEAGRKPRTSSEELEGTKDAFGFDFEATVTGVRDGGVIMVRQTEGSEVPVRLADIEMPEAPDGALAAKALADKTSGKQVRVRGVLIDANGCLLAKVWLQKRCVNVDLVKDGWARYRKSYAEDASFAEAESEARDAKRGIWAKAAEAPVTELTP